MLAVNVPRSATERAPAFGLRQQVDGVADDVVPMRFQALRRGDVLVNAMARDRRRTGSPPGVLFSGFCNARQQPVIFAASVRSISFSSPARCACNTASTCCSDMASTTTL